MTPHNVDHYTMKLKFSLLAILAALGLLAACSKAPTTTPPELTTLMERTAIEEFFYDYYAQFRPDSKHDFVSFFAEDGRLEVNGMVANGIEEIKAMYGMVVGGGKENEPKAKDAIPKGVSEMMLTNMKIDLQGDKAVATFLWHSIKSDLLTTEGKITEYGRERTELVKQEGRWLISNRVVLTEGGMPEALLKYYPKQ
ncbi:MAG: nuclear transport factor 2 family protein [Acidobacteria bacterium]|nr:nuclear transport factor 2 family protein [Acidobacteriota bacterium]